jgi:quercetin dioxygenase-like cupin family protein
MEGTILEITRRNETPTVEALPGLVRRVLAHSPSLMLVENTIAAGTVLPVHQHPHEQILYVQSGELRLRCDGEKHTMRTGDSCVFAGDVPHGVVAVTDLVVLDIFTPEREDFLAPGGQ